MHFGQTVRILPLLADAGIPMIFVTFPAMLIALIPVIAIESLVIRRKICVNTWDVIKATTVANLVSTLVGVPLAWGVLFLAEMGFFSIPAVQNRSWNSPIGHVIQTILSAPWLGPSGRQWVVPLAALVLLVPFFLVSVWFESLIAKLMLPTTDSATPLPGEVKERNLWRAVYEANLLTYSMLGVLTCSWLVWSMYQR